MKPDSTVKREGYLNENYHYFHLQDTAGQERSFHFHEFDKIVLLRSGKVEYVVEDVSYTLEPWTVLLVRHHAIHKAMIDKSEPYDRVILYLDRNFFERALPDAGLTECFDAPGQHGRCLLVPDAAQREALSRALDAYEKAMKDPDPYAQAMRDTLMMQLLIHINRISAEGVQISRDEKRYDEKIQKTLSYINENLTADLTVEKLAENVYLSRYHFMHLFKLQTGTTVHAYIRQRRLLHAARRIREGIPAGQAALESGFGDYSVFTRAFREAFGIRPSELKKQ